MKQHAAPTAGTHNACGRNRRRVYAASYEKVIELVRAGDLTRDDLCRHCCGPVFTALDKETDR